MALELAFEHVGPEQKIPGIPDISRLEIPQRIRRIRLLDECFDLADALAERSAAADVAVARPRLARRDAEGGDVAGLRGLARRQAGGVKQLGIENDVIGGE